MLVPGIWCLVFSLLRCSWRLFLEHPSPGAVLRVPSTLQHFLDRHVVALWALSHYYYGGPYWIGPTAYTKTLWISLFFTNNIWSYLLWSPVILVFNLDKSFFFFSSTIMRPEHPRSLHSQLAHNLSPTHPAAQWSWGPFFVVCYKRCPPAAETLWVTTYIRGAASRRHLV